MALMPRLDQRQVQTLKMTPQLQQAIKLLQLTNLELQAFVEQELERNPLLEREEAETHEQSAAMLEEAEAGAEDGFGLDVEALGEMNLNREQESAYQADIDVDNDYTNDSALDSYDADTTPDSYDAEAMSGLGASHALGSTQSTGGGGFDAEAGSLEETVSEQPDLRGHLEAQVVCDIRDPGDRLIAAYLIDGLDDAGYLQLDLAEAADALGAAPDRLEAVLAMLQRFDPPGVFARDLKECLKLQLEDRDRYDPAMQAFVEHIELLAARDFAGLRKVCGIDDEDLRDMIAEIRSLDPKPALKFSERPAEPVVPDVLMRAAADGGWIVELNAETLPRVLVDNQYYARIAKSTRSRDDRRYLSEQFQAANWLVKSLHSRAATIVKVASEIVRQQDGFFREGIRALRPLVLRDIADAIEMHESTVSRVTSNKYIATPRGMFELKYFFTTALGSTSGGDSVSAEAVRHRIRAMIDAETPKKVLSDDKIVEVLQADGIDIARRTVAKYREAMGIPSSIQRRRLKAVVT